MNVIQNPLKRTILGVQFLFVAFGATVLVPLLVGIDPSVALFTADVGTLIFDLITGGKVPVFLGSSFAFIAPIIASTEAYGMPGTLAGLMAVGLVYATVSGLIKLLGPSFIVKLFPSVVVGPVIMVIGLSLSSVAVDMAKGNWLLAVTVLAAAIITVIFAKGMMRLIPILVGLIVGYSVAALIKEIDYTQVVEANWIALPEFVKPAWNLKAILFLLPVAVAPMIEHVGDMYAIGGVTKKISSKTPACTAPCWETGLPLSSPAFSAAPPTPPIPKSPEPSP